MRCPLAQPGSFGFTVIRFRCLRNAPWLRVEFGIYPMWTLSGANAPLFGFVVFSGSAVARLGFTLCRFAPLCDAPWLHKPRFGFTVNRLGFLRGAPWHCVGRFGSTVGRFGPQCVLIWVCVRRRRFAVELFFALELRIAKTKSKTYITRFVRYAKQIS